MQQTKTMAKRILLFFLIFSALPVIATTQQIIYKFVSDPAFIPSSIGICITDVKTGETIASYNERQAIIPASTIKVITTATALRLYRPSFCLYTTVGHTGTIDETGTLHGDLVIHGGGDPSLGSAYRCRHTEDFIDQIIQRTLSNHIKSIEGRIVVDNSLFDEPAISPKWMVEDIAWDYGTGCHAFSYKDNRIEINLRYNGKSYDVTRVNPPNRFVVETSLTKGEKENITVKCENNRYTISGTIPKRKDRYRLYLSIARPDSLFITDLQEKFQTAGIEVENSNLGQLPETTWFHYPSDYLGDIVHSLNVRSDNLYAESVLRLLSLSDHEKGSAEKGIDIIRKYWQNYEADSLELFMYDGSGLARNNKVSAKYLNCVLKETARDSLIGEYFVQTLPLAGKEGSVATFMKHGELPGELRLKSGSMSDVHAYAGYYTTPQNRYAIVVMINNYTCTRAQLKQKISTLLTQVLSKKE